MRRVASSVASPVVLPRIRGPGIAQRNVQQIESAKMQPPLIHDLTSSILGKN
jgi:hypothetical protein